MSKPLRRITAQEAADILGISVGALNRLNQKDLFTVQTDSDLPRAKKFYFLDEIELYVESNANSNGEAGARAVYCYRVDRRRRRKKFGLS
jgi:hypothetical protein